MDLTVEFVLIGIYQQKCERGVLSVCDHISMYTGLISQNAMHWLSIDTV